MRITCSVEVENRSDQASNSRSRPKYSVATLALCHKSRRKERCSDKDAFLILCTHRNPKGTKYKVFNNVEKLFTKFLNDGKATIRLKEPPHDLIIYKADPLQLKGFLHGVGLTIVGQGAGKVTFSPAPTKIDKPRKKLSIIKKEDYPDCDFPESLTWLQAQNCSLQEIEPRILKLRDLQVLDLSSNSLTELPGALGEVRLRELVLHHNKLTRFPPELSTGNLGQSIQILDLSYNQITSLTPYFCLMKKLAVLSLKCNNLTRLPRNMHCLESLKMFSASHNELRVLPFGMRKLNLDTLDLFHNPLDTDVVLRPVISWELPTLKETAAFAISNQNIPFNSKVLPSSLVDYLTEHCPCPCGKKVFQNQSSCILVLDLQKLASTVVYINNSSRFKVPLEVYFCSSKCWRKFFLKKRR